MAQQEDGWPLGLRPLNMRVGLIRSSDLSGSISFSTSGTGSSSSSSFSSSDLDTQSTGSFFRDRSITLGNLIGATNILDLSRRVVGGRKPKPKVKKNYKPKIWFSLCAKADSESPASPLSLGHFLEVERRAANVCRTSQNPNGYELNEFPEIQPASEHSSLFADGQIAPPPLVASGSVILHRDAEEQDQWPGRRNGRRPKMDFPVLLSCMCGRPTN